MRLQDNISRFSKFVSTHPKELSPQIVQDVARAIVLADTRGLSDAGRGQYERVTLAGLEACGIPEFRGVSRSGRGDSALSDVMQMRIMCDVLTIVLGGDYKFAMRYSAKVAQAVGKRCVIGDYLSYDECEAILNRRCSSSFEDALRPIFERTVLYLAEMKRLQPKLDKDCTAITRDCVKSVWLPEEFESSGFNVSTKIPKVLDGVPGNIVTIVTCYNFGFVLDALIRAIVRNGKGEMAQWAFLNRLQDISSMSPAYFPVPTGVVPGIRSDVYIPFHFLNNQALRVVYGRHFDKAEMITKEGVDGFIQAIKVWLGVA